MSQALTQFRQAVAEIGVLMQPCPRSPKTPAEGELSRALCRSAIVILTSHFERYIRSLNEESVQWLNGIRPDVTKYTMDLRLLHSKSLVDSLGQTSWERRSDQLHEFAQKEAWLWLATGTGDLEHGRVLSWMKSPKPKSLVRFFKYWGVDDIFKRITRTPHMNKHFRLTLQGMIDRRNNIAHGDYNTVAGKTDITQYKNAATQFCERADKVLAKALARSFDQASPW